MKWKPIAAEGTTLRSVLDAIPSLVFLVDHKARILDANRIAKRVFDGQGSVILRRLCGEVLHCIHDQESEEGCGKTDFCKDCVVRNSVEAAAAGAPPSRRTHHMKLEIAGKVRDVWFLVAATPFKHEGQPMVMLVLEDITELAELRRLIPMCSYCRRVRDDTDFWHSVEEYLHKYTHVEFSHGLCPDCLKQHYPDVAEKLGK